MNSGRRTVVLFAHECAPFHRMESTVGAQRPAQFAKYLPEFGWRAIVICCDRESRRLLDTWTQREAEALVDRSLTQAGTDGSVIIPTPSLRSDGVTDRLWFTVSGSSRGTMARGLRKALTIAKFVHGDYSQSWQPCARLAAEALVARLGHVDACVGEHGPDAGLFLARWFSMTYGVPWIADFRDPILMPIPPPVRPLYRRVARTLVGTAHATVNVNEAWTGLDRQLFGLPAHTVPNGFDPDEFATTSNEGQAEDQFSIVYCGRIDRQQNIELFLDGFKRGLDRLAPDIRSRVKFVYRGVSSGRVAHAVAERGLLASVDVGGHVDRGDALALLAHADLLLLLSIHEPDGFHDAGFFPAKVFEYFGARRPIMCVPGDGAQLDSLLRETRAGEPAGTVDVIAERVARFAVEHAESKTAPFEPNDDCVAQYSRRRLAGRLAGILDALVESAAAGHSNVA